MQCKDLGCQENAIEDSNYCEAHQPGGSQRYEVIRPGELKRTHGSRGDGRMESGGGRGAGGRGS
jgi:hypothetical protein